MRRKRTLIALLVWAGMFCWFYLPRPEWRPLLTVEARRAPQPHSETRIIPFRFERGSQRVTIGLSANLERGAVRVELLDDRGNVLWGGPQWGGRQNQRLTFSIGSGFPAGGAYRLRVTETDANGRYRIAVSERTGATAWHRYLVLVGALTLVSGVALVWSRAAAKSLTARRGASLLAFWGLVAWLGIAYVVAHEGGHLVSLAVFGDLSPAGSDVLGLGGDPHVGRLHERLADWQEAVVGISGPALPNVIGYVLFLLWASGWGRKARGGSRRLDAFWSLATVVLLVGWLGFLGPLTGLAADSDYSGFVSHVGLPLGVSQALIVAVLCANLLMIGVVGRHMWHLMRQVRAAPVGRDAQATGTDNRPQGG